MSNVTKPIEISDGGKELLGGDRKRERDSVEGSSKDKESSLSSSSNQTASSKRPRLAFGLGGGGGNRLFGLVNSTLKQAKVDNEKKEKGEAARQRAELEARLQVKTQKPSSAYSSTPMVPSHILKNKARLEEELYRDAIALQTLVDRIVTEETVHKSLKTQKRRLASFLVTKAPKDNGIRGRVIAPYIPGAIVPTPTPSLNSDLHQSSNSRTTKEPFSSISRGFPERDAELKEGKRGSISHLSNSHNASTSNYALYFLPKKLTPSQEDLLDEQEDNCDAELDRMDSAIERKLNDLKIQLEKIQHRLVGKKLELEELKKKEMDIKEKKEQEMRQKEREREGMEEDAKKKEIHRRHGNDQEEKETDSSEKTATKVGSEEEQVKKDSRRSDQADRESEVELNDS